MKFNKTILVLLAIGLATGCQGKRNESTTPEPSASREESPSAYEQPISPTDEGIVVPSEAGSIAATPGEEAADTQGDAEVPSTPDAPSSTPTAETPEPIPFTALLPFIPIQVEMGPYNNQNCMPLSVGPTNYLRCFDFTHKLVNFCANAATGRTMPCPVNAPPQCVNMEDNGVDDYSRVLSCTERGVTWCIDGKPGAGNRYERNACPTRLDGTTWES